MFTDSRFFDELHISKISVISGIRHCGMTVDCSLNGRKRNGFLFVWEGETTFVDQQQKTTVISSGELAFLPKGKKYRMEYTAQSTTFVVVDLELCDRFGQDFALFEDITLVAREDSSHSISKIMTNFELSSVSKTSEAILRKKELIYRLLGTVCASRFSLPSLSVNNARIAYGVHLLEQTYLENRPISDYAKASHVSVNTFRSVFQKEFGSSPLKYRNRLRIERARELLSEGGLTVAEVAYACGFENIGYFCRYYRQIVNESPGETKKKYNAN